MPYPTVDVFPGRVMVGPVDEAALIVPDIFAKEADGVTLLYPGDARCQIDIVLSRQARSHRRGNSSQGFSRRAHA